MRNDEATSDPRLKPMDCWLAEDPTPCPRCRGPRDARRGCDYCRELDNKKRLSTLPPPSVGEIAS